jgi:hypothetical protein
MAEREVELSKEDAATARRMFEDFAIKATELAQLAARQLGTGFVASSDARTITAIVEDGLTTFTDDAGNCVKYDYKENVCKPC